MYSLLRPALFALPPELAHAFALKALSSGVMPVKKMSDLPRLKQSLWGLDFSHPIGLAAGCDKNAEAIDGLFSQGFGFVECGTVTPLPQSGNPKPRVFRLIEQQAIINRLGFNNAGLEEFVRNLKRRKSRGIVGGNIGKNKDSIDAGAAIADYVTCLNAIYAHVDYVTVNISSPNTQGLRNLQAYDALRALIFALNIARDAMIKNGDSHKPILIKIAPDLNNDEVAMIGELALALSVDGLIACNTTITRPQMKEVPQHLASGGLSGKPLMALSTLTLAQIARATQGKIPLIGVGGVSSAEDAYQKILHGASLVQLYSALIYQGFSIIPKMAVALDGLLARDGFSSIHEAVGKSL